MEQKISYLSGLARSGSTLVCNLLAMHSEIQSTSSSPLHDLIISMRKTASDHPFFLSQLDHNFEEMHDRMKDSVWAFMKAWSKGEKPITIDKNRSWLSAVEWLNVLDPNYKMIVTIRDLRNVYKSIELNHKKSLFIDFPDHMEHDIIEKRASILFQKGGVVGSSLGFLQNLKDVPDVMKHLYIFRYEDFLINPDAVMDSLFEFLEVKPIEIDFTNIPQSTFESDSYYRFKYRHSIKKEFKKPSDHTHPEISNNVINLITEKFKWFYEIYYPELLEEISSQKLQPNPKNNNFVTPPHNETIKEREILLNNIESNLSQFGENNYINPRSDPKEMIVNSIEGSIGSDV